MRFAIVTSLMTLTLITFASATSIAVLSWIYSEKPGPKQVTDSKIEIRWGEGS